jgi:hypothetical protein
MKWLPTLGLIGSAVLTALTPSLQAFFGRHPFSSSIIAGVIAVIAHLLPSPVGQPTTTEAGH